MISVAVIRHGPTDWNEQKRIQGPADRTLSPAGRERVAGWSVPGEFGHFDWVASPLVRAVETAELLGLTCRAEPLLVEIMERLSENEYRSSVAVERIVLSDQFRQTRGKEMTDD